jgi:hypothetical protein
MLTRWIAAHRGALSVFFSALVTSGCAIHPLPDDVAHISTPNIVRQIRCETRQAIIDSFLGFLTDKGNNQVNSNGYQKVDDRSLAIGNATKQAYDDDHDSITTFDPKILSGFARSTVQLLFNTGIAYNYDLTGLEKSNIDPTANLTRPLPISTLLSANLMGNFDRSWQNDRSFTITDNAASLVKVHANYCTKFLVEENIVYPIAGKVGMEKMIQDFLQLTLFENLNGETTKDTITTSSGPPTMVDQLNFQTTIGGSATPMAVFAPAGTAFQFMNASMVLSASRMDTHILTVGLYLDSAGVQQIAGVRMAVFAGRLITASGGHAEKGAAHAVEQYLEQKLFKPTIVVHP